MLSLAFYIWAPVINCSQGNNLNWRNLSCFFPRSLTLRPCTGYWQIIKSGELNTLIIFKCNRPSCRKSASAPTWVQPIHVGVVLSDCQRNLLSFFFVYHHALHHCRGSHDQLPCCPANRGHLTQVTFVQPLCLMALFVSFWKGPMVLHYGL